MVGSPTKVEACLIFLLILACSPTKPARNTSSHRTSTQPAGVLEDLVARCTRKRLPLGVQFQCKDLVASLSEAERVSATDLISAQLSGLRTALNGALSYEATTIVLSGQRWPATHFVGRASTTGKPIFVGYSVGRTLPGRARVAMCGGNPSLKNLAPRCYELLAAMLVEGPSAYTPPNQTPTLLGKKVTVPVGCQVAHATEDNFRLLCTESKGGEASITARVYKRSTDPFAASRATEEALLQQNPSATRAYGVCTIAGSASKCTHFIIQSTAGAQSLWLGAVKLDSMGVTVMCSQPANRSGVHPVCSQVMDF